MPQSDTTNTFMAQQPQSRTLVFVDTWAWVALADGRDRYHRIANITRQQLDANVVCYATSEYVVVETATLMRRRIGFRTANRFLDELAKARQSGELIWIPADDGLFSRAREEFTRYGSDQSISFVDATSFAAMRAAGIETAFTGDCDHFLTAGFQTVPTKQELGQV